MVPALGAKIIAELGDISATSAVVAAVDHAPLLMPIEHRLEKPFFGQGYHDITVIEADFGSMRAAVEEQGRQFRDEVIPLAPLELQAECVVPQIPVDIEIEFVGKEEVQPLSPFARKTSLKLAEEFLGIESAGLRVHRIERERHSLCAHGDETARLIGMPPQYIVCNEGTKIDLPSGDDSFAVQRISRDHEHLGR